MFDVDERSLQSQGKPRMVNVFFDGFRRSNGQIRIFSNSIGFVLKKQVLVTSKTGEIRETRNSAS